MKPSDFRPQLVINYSPQFDLRVSFAAVQEYSGIALPDYRFALDYCLRHSTGEFRYRVDDLWFGIDGFTRFADEIQGIQQGLREDAALRDPGDMVVFRLEKKANRLIAIFDVKESVAQSLAKFHVTLEVDYDLFVNKLKTELDKFVRDLREIDSLPS